MGEPAAKLGDKVIGTDQHIEMIPAAAGALVPGPPSPHPFSGTLTSGLSPDVNIMGQPAATTDSIAVNDPPHMPISGPTFQKPPSNQGRVMVGSSSVFINKKPAARNNDKVMTCNDPVDLPNGTIITDGTVRIGG